MPAWLVIEQSVADGPLALIQPVFPGKGGIVDFGGQRQRTQRPGGGSVGDIVAKPGLIAERVAELGQALEVVELDCTVRPSSSVTDVGSPLLSYCSLAMPPTGLVICERRFIAS